MSKALLIILLLCLLQIWCSGRSKFNLLVAMHNNCGLHGLTFMLNLPFFLRAFVDEEESTLVQLDDCTCLGYTQMFECTVFGGGFTIWNGTAFSGCQRDEIQLRHSMYINSQATGQCNGGKIVAKSVDVSEDCYTSHLIVSIG